MAGAVRDGQEALAGAAPRPTGGGAGAAEAAIHDATRTWACILTLRALAAARDAATAEGRRWG